MDFITQALLDDSELPWPELKFPHYGALRVGSWELRAQFIPMIRGYFRGLQLMKHPSWTLLRKYRNGSQRVWMSLTPMELESQMPHAAAAFGHTVIMGLGMGMLLYNVIRKPDVTRVTVVERDMSTVKMLRAAARMNHWDGIEKVEFVKADALKFSCIRADVVLVDIWEMLGADTLRTDCRRIYDNTRPALLAAWGMELDYVSWLHENDEVPGSSYKTYCEDIGVPLIEQESLVYPDLCIRAAQNVIQY